MHEFTSFHWQIIHCVISRILKTIIIYMLFKTTKNDKISTYSSQLSSSTIFTFCQSEIIKIPVISNIIWRNKFSRSINIKTPFASTSFGKMLISCFNVMNTKIINENFWILSFSKIWIPSSILTYQL